jgi:hypothetical protein
MQCTVERPCISEQTEPPLSGAIFLVLEVVVVLSHALHNLHEQILVHPKSLAKGADQSREPPPQKKTTRNNESTPPPLSFCILSRGGQKNR